MLKNGCGGSRQPPQIESYLEAASHKELRTQKHLTEAEVERLIKATPDNRHGHRDATMTLVRYVQARPSGRRAGRLALGALQRPPFSRSASRRLLFRSERTVAALALATA
jgi:hypothetical protein